MVVVKVSRSRGNGDCLFDSVAQILQSCGHPSANVASLRGVVASSVLDVTDTRALATMRQWRMLLRDALLEGDRALVQEFSHARALLEGAVTKEQLRALDTGPECTISQSARQALSEEMRTPRYLGEEYALHVIESALGLRVRVYQTLDGASGQWHAPPVSGEPDAREPRFVCAVLHTGLHYEPISFDGVFMFHYKRPEDGSAAEMPSKRTSVQ
jgi:hypothetical protein